MYVKTQSPSDRENLQLRYKDQSLSTVGKIIDVAFENFSKHINTLIQFPFFFGLRPSSLCFVCGLISLISCFYGFYGFRFFSSRLDIYSLIVNFSTALFLLQSGDLGCSQTLIQSV
jgi:hypothetical protein